MLNNPENLT